jgi:CheY-like chemotaxis protein
MRILLADDSEDNRFLILSYLKPTGSIVDIAENGALALGLFRNNNYDAVLMDVEMPVMDGYTATRSIRDLEHLRGAAPTPVIALSAHALADIAEKGAAAGFTELLTKPIRAITLLQTLAKYPRARQPIPIQVAEDMADVVPRYLTKRRAELVLYRDALAKGDMEAIRMMGHRMKGTGAGYGLVMLTHLGGALELAAKRGDASEIRGKLAEFADYLDNVVLNYE